MQVCFIMQYLINKKEIIYIKSEGDGIWTHNRWIWSPTLYRWSYALWFVYYKLNIIKN